MRNAWRKDDENWERKICYEEVNAESLEGGRESWRSEEVELEWKGKEEERRNREG